MANTTKYALFLDDKYHENKWAEMRYENPSLRVTFNPYWHFFFFFQEVEPSDYRKLDHMYV